MQQGFSEHDRPTEWLRALEEQANGYELLLKDAGSLTRAAYRLARARCRVAATPMAVPTVREVRAAAIKIAENTANTPRPPLASLLIEECESENLEVIAPMSSLSVA